VFKIKDTFTETEGVPISLDIDFLDEISPVFPNHIHLATIDNHIFDILSSEKLADLEQWLL
jgi:hypothetical protein